MPARELSRLQSVQNAGAWLIFSANKNDHVSSLLRDLHWLQSPQWIDYKIAVFVYRVSRTCSGVPVCRSTEHQGPAFETTTMVTVVGHVSRPCVQPVHLSATALSRLPLHESGTLCRQTFSHLVLCQLSSVDSRPSFSHEASLTDVTA